MRSTLSTQFKVVVELPSGWVLIQDQISLRFYWDRFEVV